jgi:NitT/TauT family transport system substrate-binding protein
MNRRSILAALAAVPAAAALPAGAQVKGIEKKKVTIAVGGKNLFYYLPLTIAEQLNYFAQEGLDVEIVDFAGGSAALRAVVGGSADVVSGAYEHTINLQSRGQMFTAFALQGRAPQIVLAVSTKTMPGYKSIADLKGKKIGVTAPGSSTNMMANYVLARGGLKPSDVSFIGVGGGKGAISAMQAGQIDAVANLDPVISMLDQQGLLKIVSDTRTLKETEALFGGPMPAGCLYAPTSFLERNPNTSQALANAMVRALKWLQQAGPSDIVKTVPEAFLLGDRALYLAAWTKVREAISPDGIIPEAGGRTALRTLQAFDPKLAEARIDLSKTFTNEFVRKALASVK